MTKEEAIRILKNFSLCGAYHQLIHMNDTDSEAISMAIKALEQPERPKGKWVHNIYCSECGWANEVEPGFVGSVKGFNFCPNCGADMTWTNTDTI